MIKKIGFGLIIFFLIIISCVWGYYSRKLDKSEQNLKAANSEMVEINLKNGELMAARDSYIATINDLENLLDLSKQEIKDIQKQKSKL